MLWSDAFDADFWLYRSLVYPAVDCDLCWDRHLLWDFDWIERAYLICFLQTLVYNQQFEKVCFDKLWFIDNIKNPSA